MGRLTERAEIDKCPGIWVKEGFAREGTRTWFNGYDQGYSAINKCAGYEDLEDEGKLLKLPCVAGEVVYRVRYDTFIETCSILGFAEGKTICYRVYIDLDEEDVIELSDFGKTVFLTRKEAEAALKELEGKKC